MPWAPASPRLRPHRQRQRGGGYRSEHLGTAGDTRHGRGDQRGLRLLAALVRSLTARGLSGMELVFVDAHRALTGAIATVFAGTAWQRCPARFMTNC